MALKLRGDTIIDEAGKTLLQLTDQVVANTDNLGKIDQTLLKNKYTSRDLATNANLTPNGSGGLSTIKATAKMTSNKPSTDAHILHMYWDNTGGYDSQLAVLNGNAPRIEVRGQSGGTWGSWKKVAMMSDLTPTVTKLTLGAIAVTTAASGTVLTHKITTAGTYLIMGYSNLNRYNNNGRELHVKLQKNGTDFWDYLDVGDLGWTVAVTISAVQTFAANDTLKVVITNGNTSKQWMHGQSDLWLIRLPG